MKIKVLGLGVLFEFLYGY